ncbi:LysM peptidoglycan-binding domain-containing protein [Cereibacter sediminicola]|uniref:LysM peptidoglycan-binding domain-containing protein n=1 Tax=Cereibacter sediminicola TaxID=2584941 RepID=UPI0011A25A58|nr:LysM peptidoglycan-binding domain-containing protein [Cereibacter sediminicola]
MALIGRIGSVAWAAVAAGTAAAVGGAGYYGWTLRPMPAPPAVLEGPAEPQLAAVSPPPAQGSATPGTFPHDPAPPDPAPAEPEAAGSAMPAPAAGPASGAAPPEAQAPEAPPLVVQPAFDVVRIESDGSALVAGRAQRGSEVKVLVEGEEAASTTADAANRFAVMFTLPADEQPRRLSLRMLLEDGTEHESRGSVIVAPILAPRDRLAEADDPAAAATPAPEPRAPAALLLGEGEVKVLQPAGESLDDLAGVSVDTISYASDGAVLLSGRGGVGDFVRLYLDNREIATVAIAPDGTWAVSLTGIEPGRYQLRADRIGEDGEVVARFETPFARETHETVAAALEAQNGGPPAAAASAPAAPEGAGSADGSSPRVPGADATTPLAVPDSRIAAGPEAEPPTGAPVTVTVQPGFSLWRIAQDNFGAGMLYVKVYEANRSAIRDPDLIYPGQVFTLPAATD